jgi:glycoside/pentoside/hexuronide:cation symporter, GPH family
VTSSNRIGVFTKLAYGFGLGAEGIKNNTFNVFLLFYYQQLVGLDPRLCGLALFLTLVVDAVGDPLIGAWSDGFRSRLGRRLPFMFASSLPLAGFFFAVFHPPAGASQTVLFLWLFFFASAARFSMSLFWLPHQSLVVELTDDRADRTALQNVRNIFAWLFGLLNAWLGYQVFLASTPEYKVGLLNPHGYDRFALWGACVMLLTTFVSTLGVRPAVLRAPSAHRATEVAPLRQFPRAMRHAIAGSASYRAALMAGLLLWVAFGLTENTRNYIGPFFWGFSSEQIGLLIYVIVASVVLVWVSAGPLMTRFGPRRLGVLSMLAFGLCEPTAITLRLLGILPDNSSPLLLPLLLCAWFVGFAGIIMAMTVLGTMFGDVTDEYELHSGVRQEGLLFAAGTFLQKTALGGGGLLAASMLSVTAFPSNAATAGAPADAVLKLGIFSAVTTVGFALGSAWFFSRFKLDRQRHEQILAQLEARRGGAALQPDIVGT